jgi:hypothetical protein
VSASQTGYAHIYMFGSKEERGEILIANVFGSRGEGR